MINVLFFTCEPGGAEVLIPVIKLLKQNNGYKITVCSYGYALERFNLENISYELISPITENDNTLFEQYKPKIIITSATSLPYKDMSEKYLWSNAKFYNITTIAFIDQWQNFAIRFSGIEKNETLKFQPDYINAINKDGFDEMKSLGFNQNILMQWGQPYLSGLHEKQKNIDCFLLKKELNIADEKVLLFVSEAIKENYSNTRGYDQYTVLDLFLTKIQLYNENFTIIIKLHPKDNLQKFNNILNKFEDLRIIIITNEYTPIETISLSDIVIGMTSIMLIEAFILDKVVFSYQPNLKGEDPLIISRKDYILKSYTDNIDFDTFMYKKESEFLYEFKKDNFLNFLESLL